MRTLVLMICILMIIVSGCTPIQEHYKPLYQVKPKKKVVGEDTLK